MEEKDKRAGGYRARIKETKTNAGTRQLSFDDATASHLIFWKEVQADVLTRITRDGKH